MGLETATYTSDLVSTNPTTNDPKNQGDDHLRLLKSTIKATFPNISGAVTPTHVELNYVDGVTSAIQTQLDAKGAVAGQTWTGTHTFPATTYGVTASLGDSSTKLATTAFVAGTAFSSALPAQTGSNDKLITTDGTTASWTGNLKAGTIRFVDSTDTTKVMAFSLSGLTTGSTRTITMPDKSGTLAMLSDAGMPSPLAVLTPTAAANVDALTTFSSSYDNYLIIGDGLLPSSNDNLMIQFAVSGSADSGSNYYRTNEEGFTTTTATTAGIIANTSVITAGTGCNFILHVLNVNDATNLKSIAGKVTYQINATPGYRGDGLHVMYPAANTVSGVRFFWSGGANFSAVGKIRIYGISNS